jgi:16S rRNA G966 N2-methylase RsmD
VADKRLSRKLEYSDIDLSRWKEYEDILTNTWWQMKSRERGKGHVFDYHGNFIPQIANQTFRRYTHEGDIVVDWFLGSGTSAIEAVNLNRRLIGVELKAELVEHVRDKLPSEYVGDTIKLIQGDSSSIKAKNSVQKALLEMGCKRAHLAVLHPPYADIIKFSELKADLSNCSTTDDFLAGFEKVAHNAYDALEKGRFAVLVIGDKYSAGELDPLGFKCMQRMNEVGFRTKSIIVKNIEGNEKGKGRDTNLWRYRALSGGFYIFKHEYVMIFFK